MYFVTVCVHDHECLLGKVEDGLMHLSRAGRIVLQAWCDLPRHYPHVVLDAFCGMPNHVHGIIVLTEDELDGDGGRGGSSIEEVELAGKTRFSICQEPEQEQPRLYVRPSSIVDRR